MGQQLFEFGPFRLDPIERVLLRQGEPVSLTPKVFDLLLLLLENRGLVVEKERLMQEVWPGTFVEEGNLTQNISVLRKTLGESQTGHQYIQTVPRRGYRFVGRVAEVLDEVDEVLIAEHSLARVVVKEQQTGPFRFGRAAALGAALLIGAGVAGGYFLFIHPQETVQTRTETRAIRSIAVLPFQVLGTNSGDEFLGLGMTDALISRLGSFRQLQIRPTSAVRKYASAPHEAAAIASELHVDSLLEGNIQRVGDRIRVSVQLIYPADGTVLWTQAFDEKFTDVLSVEDVISLSVAQSLAIKLTASDQTRSSHRATSNVEAYELFLRGRFNLNQFSEEGTRLARQYFEQALQKDAEYAEGYAALAESYAFGEIGLPPGEAFPRAREAASKAIALDDQLGEAHAALAQVAFLWDWNWKAADEQFKRALELSPGDPEIHHMYAHYLTAMERFDQALTESQLFLQLDPLSPASRNHLGWYYLYSKQFDKAIEQYRLVLALDPNFHEAHRQLAEAYWNMNKYDDAVEEIYKRYELLGRRDDGAAMKQAYLKSGWKGLWRKRHEVLLERSKQGSLGPTSVACSYAGLNDKPRVMDWLERAYREHDHDLVYSRVDNCWNIVRSEPRFQELLKKLDLPR